MHTKTQHASASLAEIVIVVLIIIALNWLAYFYFFRLDMTADKEYTVSQATKGILTGLDDKVSIEFFMSRDLPPEFASRRDEIKNKLSELVAFSHGNLKLRYTDPADDEKEKERAKGLGINEFQAQVMAKDKMSSKNVFMGLVLNYEDKSETIPMAVDAASLEYQLASSIKRMTMKEKPKIGIFNGPFVANQQQQPPSYQGLGQILGGQEGFYEVVPIDPKEQQLPEGLAAVIIAGAFGMSESLKYSLDQFLLNGGQVIVALDPMMETGQQGALDAQAYPSLPTIEEQLEKYGVRFDKQLIVDQQCGNAPFSNGMFQVLQPYPLWPKVGPQGFNKDIAAVSLLESLVLPWCCPLKDPGVPGVTYSVLASSSADSFVLASPFNLDPQQDWAFKKTASESQGPYTMVAMVQGEFPTAFASGPPAPSAPAPTMPGEAPAPAPASPFSAADQLQKGNGQGHLVVISSATGLSDNFLQLFRENILFIANLSDMLVMGDDLLGIRSAVVTARPLVQMSDAQKSIIRWLNVLLVPLLLIAAGLLLWFIKGRQRQALQQHYGG
jgi:ABC-2 type transport system permease protein